MIVKFDLDVNECATSPFKDDGPFKRKTDCVHWKFDKFRPSYKSYNLNVLNKLIVPLILLDYI